MKVRPLQRLKLRARSGDDQGGGCTGARLGRFIVSGGMENVRAADPAARAGGQHDGVAPDEAGFQFEAGLGGLLFLLAFGGAALLDDFAHRAGMFAIEGLADGFGKGGLLRVADEHAGPGHRLQERPVQAQTQDQQQDDGKAEDDAHGGKMRGGGGEVNGGVVGDEAVSAARESRGAMLCGLIQWGLYQPLKWVGGLERSEDEFRTR